MYYNYATNIYISVWLCHTITVKWELKLHTRHSVIPVHRCNSFDCNDVYLYIWHGQTHLYLSCYFIINTAATLTNIFFLLLLLYLFSNFILAFMLLCDWLRFSFCRFFSSWFIFLFGSSGCTHSLHPLCK